MSHRANLKEWTDEPTDTHRTERPLRLTDGNNIDEEGEEERERRRVRGRKNGGEGETGEREAGFGPTQDETERCSIKINIWDPTKL